MVFHSNQQRLIELERVELCDERVVKSGGVGGTSGAFRHGSKHERPSDESLGLSWRSELGCAEIQHKLM